MNFNEAKIEELKEADAIAIGSSTFYYKMLPPMEKFIESLENINLLKKILKNVKGLEKILLFK